MTPGELIQLVAWSALGAQIGYRIGNRFEHQLDAVLAVANQLLSDLWSGA